MKRKGLTLALALSLCLGLAAPAMAYDMGKVGERNVVSAGGLHTAVIDGNGTLWTWGWNEDGQLGNGTQTDSSVPVRVMEQVVSVSAGVTITAAIQEDGSLWIWGGDNYHKESGAFYKTAPVKAMEGVTAVSVGADGIAAIKRDGTLWQWELDDDSGSNGWDFATPVQIMEDVVAVSCAGRHYAAIRADGSLWMWGRNGYGQLGNGSQESTGTPVKVLDNVAAVSCGWGHTAALKTDGTLWMWGYNRLGELGNGWKGNAESDGEVCQTLPVQVMEHVASVSAGNEFTAAVGEDGSLWTWGMNCVGNLGNGGTGDEQVDIFDGEPPVPIQTTPVKVMADVMAVRAGGGGEATHTIAVKTDGTLWGFGNNLCGELANIPGNKTLTLGETSIPIQTVPAQMTGVGLPLGVRLSLGGGAGVTTLWTASGEALMPPANPTRPGYAFGGWYTDGGCTKLWNFDSAVTPGLMLYARWLPLSSTAETTSKSQSGFSVDGKAVSLDAYTLKADDNGGDVTFVKLRDVAKLLDGTDAQCNVDWKNGAIRVTAKAPYSTPNGAELQAIEGGTGAYRQNTSPILFDGTTQPLEGIVITDGAGGGHTFFKLRDLGKALDFYVGWSKVQGVYIETDRPYSEG